MSKLLDRHGVIQIPAFGYEILRDGIIPEILGRDTAQIMYYSGRALAKKYPCTSLEDIIAFFDKAGWGRLVVDKDKKDELLFSLTSALTTSRLAKNKEANFSIEAGFLAETIQSIKKYATETHEKVNSKKGIVTFTVGWDLKEEV
jgi:hypothetical protein